MTPIRSKIVLEKHPRSTKVVFKPVDVKSHLKNKIK